MPESHGVDHCLTVLKHQEAAIQEGIIFFKFYTISEKLFDNPCLGRPEYYLSKTLFFRTCIQICIGK